MPYLKGSRGVLALEDFLKNLVGVVSARWTEPDEGIWEVRGGRRHFVVSKIMAWVAVDRAIELREVRESIDCGKTLSNRVFCEPNLRRAPGGN